MTDHQVKVTETEMRSQSYELVYIAGGICDITLRDMHTKITVLRTTNQDETINKLQNLIHGGIAEISKISNAKVVVLPIAGIHLNRYNRRTGTSEDQRILNFMMITPANKLIIDINNEPGIATPGAVGLIHRCKSRGRWPHRYKYLISSRHAVGTGYLVS